MDTFQGKSDMLISHCLLSEEPEVSNTMTLRLTPISQGVAHSSSHRTRLKVPKDHNIAANSLIVKDAIERVPGVKDVKVVPPIGSVVVEHDDRPDVLENIGE